MSREEEKNDIVAALMEIDNLKIDFSYMPRGQKTPKMINFKRIQARSTTLCTRQRTTLNTA